MQLSNATLPIAHALRRVHQAIPIRGWQRIFRLAFDPAKQADFAFEIPLFDGRFVGHANHWVDWVALFYGCYEKEDLTRAREILRRLQSPVILDIGANVGHHAIALCVPGAHVHAFEPYPPRLECLRVNVSKNPHLAVTIHPVALGGEDCEASFSLPVVTTEWSGVHLHPEGDLTFPMRHASDYLKTNGITRVDFIKIDVDGSELDVVQGLQQTISDYRPTIMIECALPRISNALPNYHCVHGQNGNVFCYPR